VTVEEESDCEIGAVCSQVKKCQQSPETDRGKATNSLQHPERAWP
jgi:hypothetical protein